MNYDQRREYRWPWRTISCDTWRPALSHRVDGWRGEIVSMCITYHIIYNCRGYLQHAAQSIFHLFNGGVNGHDPGRSIGLGWQQNWFRFERLDRGKKEPKNLSFLSNYRYGSWTRAAPSERPTMTTTLFHSWWPRRTWLPVANHPQTDGRPTTRWTPVHGKRGQPAPTKSLVHISANNNMSTTWLSSPKGVPAPEGTCWLTALDINT